MTREHNILIWDNGHLTVQSIESYNNNELSHLDMHKAERHILNCDLCADALEGYGQKTGNPKVRKNLEFLRHQIRQEPEGPQKSGSVFRTLAIAASLAIILGARFYFFGSSILWPPEEPQIAMKRKEDKAKAPPELPIVEASDLAEDDLSNEQTPAGTDSRTLENPAARVPNAIQSQVANQSLASPAGDGSSGPALDQNQALAANEVQQANALDAELESDESVVEFSGEPDLELKEEIMSEAKPTTEEDLEEAKNVINERAKSSDVEGGPELAISTRLTSGAKLGGSIMDSDPEPEIGFDQYRVYLLENLQYPDEARLNNISGVVKIEFALKPGSLYSKFRIVEGLGYGCDEEAERLIKDGPNWKPAIRKGLAIKEEVVVEIKFEP